MKNFDSRTYSISDFLEWDSNGLLNLSPEFQRRSVWSEKAKSYLIDTIVRGKPIPKILITQELKQSRNVRVVVDGQQRLRSILEFVEGSFKISRAHNREFAGNRYDSLPDDIQRDFLKYELAIDVLFDMDYADILDVFARINTYSIKLNNQEILNAKYLGFFKQTAYSLGYRYVDYWIQGGILTKSQVNRMSEATLASDLLVALVSSVQNPRAVETYYRRFEDEPGDLEEAEQQFDSTMTFLGEIYPPNELKETNFSKIALFYSLFVSIAHILFKVEGIDAPRPTLNKENFGRARVRLDEISARFDEKDPPAEYLPFVEAGRRGTTDAVKRKFRSEFICKKLNEALVE